MIICSESYYGFSGQFPEVDAVGSRRRDWHDSPLRRRSQVEDGLCKRRIANETQAHAERCSHEGDIVTTFIH